MANLPIPYGIVLAAVLAFTPIAVAQPATVAPDDSAVNLAPHLSTYTDLDRALTIDDVLSPDTQTQFEAINQPKVNFGVIAGAAWIRFELANASGELVNRYLVIERATMDIVELYSVDEDGRIQQQEVRGATHFYDRPVPARQPVFTITLRPNETRTYYLRFNTVGATSTDITLFEPQVYRDRDAREVVGMGLYFGTILIMAAHYAIMFAIFRARSYLYLALMVLFSLLYVATYTGYVFQFVFPTAENLSQRFTLPFAGCMFGFGAMFASQFLDARNKLPVHHKVFMICTGLGFSLCIVNYMSDIWTDRIAYTLGVLLPGTILTAAIWGVLDGTRSAKILLAAWVLLLVSTFGYAFAGLDLIPASFLTEHGTLVTFPIMLLMLSLAVWDKIKAIEEKDRDTLERRVDERTRELAEALDSVRTLEGLIPICAHCKKVRDDAGYWGQIEGYIASRSEAQFSHGICPDCLEEHFKDYAPPRNDSADSATG